MKKIIMLALMLLMVVGMLFVGGCTETATDDHDHGDEDAHTHEGGTVFAYEWAGVFEMPKGEYSWTMQKVDGKFADPAMKLLIMKTSEASWEGMALKKDVANCLFQSDGIEFNHGDTLTPGIEVYKLIYDDALEEASFKVNVEEDGAYIFFTEHFPYEFEATEHFLKDDEMVNVEPAAENPDYDGFLKHMEEHGKEVAHGHDH